MTVDVYDDLFDEEFIQQMDSYVRTLPFNQTEVDKDLTHLSQGKSSDFDFNHPLIEIMVEKFNQYLTNSELQRVYCNKILNSDSPQSHTDSKYEVDMTALYYVNKDYNFEWGGETLFYKNEDVFCAVTPIPGRVAIFPGNILHSARPFLMHITEPRYTVAFKYVFSF